MRNECTRLRLLPTPSLTLPSYTPRGRGRLHVRMRHECTRLRRAAQERGRGAEGAEGAEGYIFVKLFVCGQVGRSGFGCGCGNRSVCLL